MEHVLVVGPRFYMIRTIWECLYSFTVSGIKLWASCLLSKYLTTTQSLCSKWSMLCWFILNKLVQRDSWRSATLKRQGMKEQIIYHQLRRKIYVTVQFSAATDTNQQFKQKGCTTDDKLCNLEFSATLGNQQKFRYKNHCCTGEQCNNDTISREYTSCLCLNT